MATTKLLNVDDEGNILSPKVLARLAELFGAGGSYGITASTTLDELADTEAGA